MKNIDRNVQKCINRFEFALLVYYDSDNDNGLSLYNIFTVLQELLRDDLVRLFKGDSGTKVGK